MLFGAKVRPRISSFFLYYHDLAGNGMTPTFVVVHRDHLCCQPPPPPASNHLPRNWAVWAQFWGWQLFSVSDDDHNHARPPPPATQRWPQHRLPLPPPPATTPITRHDHTNNRLLRKRVYTLVFVGGHYHDRCGADHLFTTTSSPPPHHATSI